MRTPKHMKHVLCTVHDFYFAFEDKPKVIETHAVKCPVCSLDEIVKQQWRITELQEHLGVLLKAIDLKQTLQPVTVPEET